MLRIARRLLPLVPPSSTGTSPVCTPPRKTCSFPFIVSGRPQMRYLPSGPICCSRTRGVFLNPSGSDSYQSNETFAPWAAASVSASRTKPTSAAGPNVRRAAGQSRATRFSLPGTER